MLLVNMININLTYTEVIAQLTNKIFLKNR